MIQKERNGNCFFVINVWILFICLEIIENYFFYAFFVLDHYEFMIQKIKMFTYRLLIMGMIFILE